MAPNALLSILSWHLSLYIDTLSDIREGTRGLVCYG